jgi:hypothetical protein
MSLYHLSLGIELTVMNFSDPGFTDDDFMICPASITVFSLDKQEWCGVGVSHLKPKQWNSTAFDRLVLNQETKDTLTKLAKTNSRRVQSKKPADVIEGKGQGVVLLLHGPPGVAKPDCRSESI